jgi:hypothetical protein
VLGTLVSAALICVAAPVVGQAILRLCGTTHWSWLAPSVGISALMLGAVPALHTPGRSTTIALLLALAVVAALVAAAVRPDLRPPVVGVLAAAPVGVLALVPFAANGHAGTLGVSFNNDMATHLALAEAYRSESIAHVLHVDPAYPIGPHALVGALAQGLGVGVDEAFAGLTIAVPVLLAWTALAALDRPRWLGQILVATLVGMPFLVAGYYGQGSFKELLQSVFVVAFAIALHRRAANLRGRLRWIPPALLVAGALSVYSWPGIVWPAAFFSLWVAGVAVGHVRRGRPRSEALAGIRAEVAPIGIAAAVLSVLLVPQLPRLARFVSSTVGTNVTVIPTEGPSALGNLAGPLPFWEAFGAWDNPDYRMPPIDPFITGMWTAIVVGFVLVGVAWWLRRGEWFLPAAAATSAGIWLYADRYQAPYVAAKGLMILTPLLMLVATRPVAEDAVCRRPLWRFGAGALVVLLTIKLVGASWDSLRFARVGPRAHLQELRELRPLVGRRPTLFLGNDDFIRWELAGVPVRAPVIAYQGMSTRPEKPWTYGSPFDFDSLDAPTLNQYEWIIAPRDAAGSSPPKELRLEKLTRSFALWRRVAPIAPRSVLAEGAAAGAVLDCSNVMSLRLRQANGVAAVREPTISAPLPPLPPGAVHELRLPLTAGIWELQTPYESQHPIEITAPGLRTTLPASLDRPGTRWRIGRLRLLKPTTITLRLGVKEASLAGEGHTASMNAILATPAAPPRVVPLREACGKLVDWFRPTVS